MSSFGCRILVCISVAVVTRVGARRLKRDLDLFNRTKYEPGSYVLNDMELVRKTAYSDEIVGHVSEGQQVEVKEILEVQADRIVWGRIEEPIQGMLRIADLEKEYAQFQEEKPSGVCEIRQQGKGFCEYTADAMQWYVLDDIFKTDRTVGVARLKHKHKRVCYLQYARGAKTEAEAQRQAMECCEKKRAELDETDKQNEEKDRNPTKDCKLLGPSANATFERKCKFRLGKKVTMADKCYCPKERPHVLKDGSVKWHQHGEMEFYIGVDEKALCIDECTARSMPGTLAPAKTDLNRESWPVVFLVVYKLGFGIVHSNLAFCPDASILEGKHPCLQPGASCGASHHESEFAKGNDVPRLLMEHNCRELIFDGNHGPDDYTPSGGLWTPAESETGCWAQGMSAQNFWWWGGDNGNYRSGTGYQRLFWLSSDNQVRPFADQTLGFIDGALSQRWMQSESGENSLQMRLAACRSEKLGTRLDFNERTYSLLHHNCNKFSSEAMRELDLPKFSKGPDKGYHSAIALSATEEESSLRRGFHKIISVFERARSEVSEDCKDEIFGAEVNCRRIGWGGRKGDCPVESQDEEGLRCYDPKMRSAFGTEGLSKPVEYNHRVNGVCAVPAGKPCKIEADSAPCQPGFHCVETEVTTKVKVGTKGKIPGLKKMIYEEQKSMKTICKMDDTCSSAVSGATMRLSEQHVDAAWCKCPEETFVKCGDEAFGRLFNPSTMKLKGACTCEPVAKYGREV